MERSADWLKQARAELAAARALLAAGHWAWCCFTSQQAGEKALKAGLEHFRADRMGHNLNELCNRLEGETPVPAAVREACARLNRYYIPTRYPDAFPSGVPVEQYFEPDAVQSVADAEEGVRFVESIIGSP